MAYDYNINDSNKTKQNDGIPLNITKESCTKFICQISIIIKNSSSIKSILLKIRKSFSEIKYIKLRYRDEISNPFLFSSIKEDLEDFEHFSKPPLISFLPCIILGLPNIIMYIVRKCQRRMSSAFFVLFMNLILNFAYGNIVSILIGIGDHSSFLLAKYSLIGYGILCFISLFCQCCGVRAYFDVIYNLCRKLNKAQSFYDTMKFNRTVPPLILVGVIAQHQESREVWVESERYEEPVYIDTSYTDAFGIYHNRKEFSHNETKYRYRTTHYSNWERVDRGGGRIYGTPGHSDSRYSKSVEYKTVRTWSKEEYFRYGSWQDNTNSLENIKYSAIIKAKFTFNITFDSGALQQFQKLKSDLFNEGKRHDTDVSTYHNYQCPKMINKITCTLNEEEYNRIQKKFSNCCGYFWWFIIFILGYSSMFESFARYEIVKQSIIIQKMVSNTYNLRASYNSFDNNPPTIFISFRYSKIQKKN